MTYHNTRTHINEIVRLANKFIEAGAEEDGEKLLVIAHEIGGETLQGNFPNSSLLGSLNALLQDQGISFALIGGVAVSVHGILRSTDDIDALVSKLPDISDADYARRFGFYRAKSKTGTVLTIDHRENGFVELLLANNSLFDYALRMATPHPVLGSSVPVIQPDALIGMKVRALTNNPSRETKDAIDILAVNRKSSSPKLDQVRGLLSTDENEKLNQILGIKDE